MLIQALHWNPPILQDSKINFAMYQQGFYKTPIKIFDGSLNDMGFVLVLAPQDRYMQNVMLSRTQ